MVVSISPAIQFLRRRTLYSSLAHFRCLNLQEYQSKELLRANGCVVQNFFVVDRQPKKDLDASFRDHAYSEFVVKAQILAGGRGRGHFLEDQKGGRRGVFITRSPEEARSSIFDMLGKRLVTNQTPSSGVLVNRVMVAESVQIKRETYLSILLDPIISIGPVVIACPSGGMDIEELAKKSPELILREPISILDGISAKQCQKIAEFLQFRGPLAQKAAQQIQRLYELFVKVDATQIEINPFAETEDGQVYCIDAKVNFDDNAAFRQKPIFDMDTFGEMDMREIRAKKCGLNYIGLDGNIACLVNGAGLAMATMDIIKLYGGLPANFLDVGGGATTEQVYEAFKIITSSEEASNVKVIFVNIFGGILRCDIIAEGVVRACTELRLDIPVVLRLKGTRVDEAKKLLSDAAGKLGVTFDLLESFEEAAKRAVELASNGGSGSSAEQKNVARSSAL